MQKLTAIVVVALSITGLGLVFSVGAQTPSPPPPSAQQTPPPPAHPGDASHASQPAASPQPDQSSQPAQPSGRAIMPAYPSGPASQSGVSTQSGGSTPPGNASPAGGVAPSSGSAQSAAPQSDSASRQRMLVDANAIIGSTVRNPEGKDIGRVSRLMVDPRDGHIATAVIGVGGVLGIGEKLVSVPWSSMKVSQDNGNVVLVTDQKMLDQAPAVDHGRDKGNEGSASPPTSGPQGSKGQPVQQGSKSK